MSYDEEQQRKSRIVVETPTARREVVQTQTTRLPERRGYSTGVVAAVAITAMALTAILFLLLSNPKDATDATNSNINLTAAPSVPVAAPAVSPPVIIQQQPMMMPPTSSAPPVIIQQPPPAPVSAPPATIVVPPPSTSGATTPSGSSTTTTTTSSSTTGAPVDDSALETAVLQKITDDPDLSDVRLTVAGGKVTLTGTVSTPALKRRAETLARVKGVAAVVNRISIASIDAPSTSPSTSTTTTP